MDAVHSALNPTVTAPPAWSRPEHRRALNDAGRRLVVVDVETVGLDPVPVGVVEVGWYDIGVGLGGRFVPPHDVHCADPVALDVCGYYRRGLDQEPTSSEKVDALHGLLSGAVLVNANPAFDAAWLATMFDDCGLSPRAPWHYRLVDTSAAAYWLSSDAPIGQMPGLARAAEVFGVPLNNHHSALDDALSAAQQWHAAEDLRRRR